MAIFTLSSVKFLVRWNLEGKDKVLSTKWDYLAKHVCHRKVAKDIGTNVKKGDWYYSKFCRHAKNQKLFTFHGCESITTQVAHGVAGKNARKMVHFVTMLHLLQQGCPMLEYEALKPLFIFLQVQKNNKKHYLVIILIGQWQSLCIKRF
jgi:hypothetical protein